MATLLVAHGAWSKTIRYAWGGRQQRRHPADPMVPCANYSTDVAIVATLHEARAPVTEWVA